MGFKNIFRRQDRANIESIQSDFVSLSSHQLRTPLSAIKWYVEMLLSQKQGKLTEKQLLYLQQISRSNERAINLVNDLLDVSRIQEGQIHLEVRPIRIEKVIEEVVDNYNTLIKSSKVNVDFQIVNGPLPEVEADQDKIKRVVMNLLSNAIKYTPAGGRIQMILEKSKHYITVSVVDSGVGIPKEDESKIFEKFFRSQNVIKLAPDGTGL